MIMSVVLLLGGYLSGGWTELIGKSRRGKGEIFLSTQEYLHRFRSYIANDEATIFDIPRNIS